MPRVTIWIREEDFEAWRAIENKPEWLHNAIQKMGYVSFKSVDHDKNSISTSDLLETTPAADHRRSDPVPVPIHFQPEGRKFCKHGYSPEMCKFAKIVNGKKVCK